MEKFLVESGREFEDTPIIILCGGKGIILPGGQSERTNKALIPVKGKPLIYWVMASYALHGATEFLLAVGFQRILLHEVLMSLGARVSGEKENLYEIELNKNLCHLWVVESLPEASTGDRLLSCRETLCTLGLRENFAVAYSDTLSDADLGSEMRFHKKHNRIATVLASRLPVRFRVLGIRNNEVLVRGFSARPIIESSRINGGFYLFTYHLWEFLNTLTPNVALENQPLEELAASHQLVAFEHDGGWHALDSERDLVEMERMAQSISTSLSIS